MAKFYSLILSLLLITGALYSQHEIVTDNNRACKNVGVRFTCKTSNTAAKYYKWGKSWPLSNYTLSKDTVFSFPEVDYYYINVEIYDENKQYIGSAYKYYNVLGLTGANIPEKVCPGDEVRLNLNGSGIISGVLWYGDGKTSSNLYSTHKYNQSGIYNVKGIIKSECGIDTVKHIINVMDGLGFIGYLSSSVNEKLTCPGAPISVGVSSERGYPYTIDFGDGTTANVSSSYHMYNNIGKYPISITFRNGCGKDSVRHDTITIAENLTWKNKSIYISKKSKGCPGETFYFYTNQVADSIIWTFEDKILHGNNASRTFNEIGKHYFTLRLVNHCGNDTILKDSISIEGNIRDIKINARYKEDKVCPQTEVFLSIATQMKNVAWHFADGTIIDNETVTLKKFDNLGKYPYKIILTNYCGFDSIIHDTISIVNKELNFNSFYIEKKLVCPGEIIKLINLPRELKEISIDYGDGFFTSTNEGHAYSTPGKYYFKIKAVNNCGNSANYLDSITVLGDAAPFGSVLINIKGSTMVCPGTPVELTTDNYKSIVWEFESQKVYGNKAKFTFNTLGKNIVKLTVKNSCGKDTTVEGTVEVINNMNTSSSSNHNVYKYCAGSEARFTSNPYGYNFFWSFGDGDTSKLENPIHIYKENGTYYSKLTSVDGCGNTLKDSFMIIISDTFNIPKPEISYTSGCPGDLIEFKLRLFSDYLLSYDANPSNFQIDWEFADGIKSGASVLHSFSTDGRHPFKVKIRNKCGKELVVNDTVDIGGTLFKEKLNWFTNKASCLGDSVIFFIPPYAKTMELDFGDNTKTSSFKDLWYSGSFYTEIPFTDLFYNGKWYKVASHKYASEGNYKVKLKATDGCNNVYSDSIAFSVNSFSAPSGEVVYNSNRTYCIGEKVKFDAFSAAGAIIDFGDGKKQTLGNNAVSSIEHKYEASGIYNVRIKVSNACSDTAFYDGVIQIDTCRKIYLSNDIITETKGIRVYPNPARDRITFENIDGVFSKEYTFEILDLNGRICKQGNIEEGTANFTLDISKLTNGIYLMKLRSRSSIIVQKFIKN